MAQEVAQSVPDLIAPDMPIGFDHGEVEAVARALYNDDEVWGQLSEQSRGHYLDHARRAISALALFARTENEMNTTIESTEK